MRKSIKRMLTCINLTLLLSFPATTLMAQTDFWQQTNGPFGGTIKSLAVNSNGDIFAGTSGGGVFRSVESPTAVEEISTRVPSSFALEQNYPNPFNPSTTIQFSVPRSSFVSLKVYNILGKEVAVLVTEDLSAGTHKLQWHAGGQANPVYYYRLQVGEFVETRKLILLK